MNAAMGVSTGVTLDVDGLAADSLPCIDNMKPGRCMPGGWEPNMVNEWSGQVFFDVFVARQFELVVVYGSIR